MVLLQGQGRGLFSAPMEWVPFGHDYGAFSIKGDHAYYTFKVAGSNEEHKVERMGIQQYAPVWPTPDRYLRNVHGTWQGKLDEFIFERALALETPHGAKAVFARFWAYPTHGNNFRYIHLSYVNLLNPSLATRAKCGNIVANYW